MMFAGLKQTQRGLTLLEVLIALSIFSLIGVASYRVLNATIQSQQVSEVYSQLLAERQKALAIIDCDLQQVLDRSIRNTTVDRAEFLLINQELYPLEFTRGGRKNPLMLPRSSMQRIAYDIGPHPKSSNRDSQYYRDDRSYLRRHIWSALDREEDAPVIVQVLLADVSRLTVAVLSEEGRHQQWPLPEQKADPVVPLAIEISLLNDDGDQLSRLYPVLQ